MKTLLFRLKNIEKMSNKNTDINNINIVNNTNNNANNNTTTNKNTYKNIIKNTNKNTNKDNNKDNNIYHFILNTKKNKTKSALSLIEIMVSLIILTVAMAAFVPLITKRASQKVKTGYIKKDSDCAFINSNCYLCDTRRQVCLSCELSCINGQTLNYNKCKCE